MLSTISRPTPGTANTLSVITAPPSSAPTCKPTSVTVDGSALRSTCRNNTTRRDRPFERAKSTNSACSTSRTAARRLRMMTAEKLSASVRAGSSR